MPRVALAEFELVAQVFVPAGGPAHPAGYTHLTALWRRCQTVLKLTEPTRLALPTSLPEPTDLPRRDGAVAAAAIQGGRGGRQMFAYRWQDVVGLSVVLGPAEAGWGGLEADWDRVRGDPHPAVLGEARLRLAQYRLVRCRLVRWWRTGGSAHHLPTPVLAELARLVDRCGPPGTRPDPLAGRAAPDLTVLPDGFVVGEAPGLPDDRWLRRLAVVAPAEAGARLSTWAWSDGRAEPPPLTRYLLHAAVLRYELRVWLAARPRLLPQRVDARLARLLPLLDAAADEGRPRPVRWDEHASQLDRLVADEAELLGEVAELRGLRRTVQIAADNMARLVPVPVPAPVPAGPGPGPAGPIADDHALAAWLDQQLDDDTTYLEAVLHRTSTVGALLDRSVRHQEASRRERYTLVQTATIGAVVMALTATQALSYQFPVPAPVRPATVAGLGAIAFYLPLAMTRLALARRGGAGVVERLARAALTAAGVWLGLAWLATVTRIPSAWIVGAPVGAFLVAWLAPVGHRVVRRRCGGVPERAGPGPGSPEPTGSTINLPQGTERG